MSPDDCDYSFSDNFLQLGSCCHGQQFTGINLKAERLGYHQQSLARLASCIALQDVPFAIHGFSVLYRNNYTAIMSIVMIVDAVRGALLLIAVFGVFCLIGTEMVWELILKIGNVKYMNAH